MLCGGLWATDWAEADSYDETAMHELLTPGEMGQADRMSIEAGPFAGLQLMRNAGVATAGEILRRFSDSARVDVLCGPGNNGGDGYVIAGELHRAGMAVAVYALAPPKPQSDAARAAADCPLAPLPIEAFHPDRSALVVDALFGAGLERPLAGAALEAVEKTAAAGSRVVAVDLPSGVSGDSGFVLGGACAADLTVTFFRKKPGHLLYPGRGLCGEVIVADIGISSSALDEVRPRCFENLPPLWQGAIPLPAVDAHKYSRGAAGVFSGGPSSTGAARLAAMAAQRAGAGAVTVFSPASAMQVNAGHLTSIMLARLDTADDLAAMLRESRARAFVIGPGFGVGEKTREFVSVITGADPARPVGKSPAALVLDADALTSFTSAPAMLFNRPDGGPAMVLTPHEGEFARVWPDLAANSDLSRLDRARTAAKRAAAVVVLKGPDTVIAAPDGRAAINSNGTRWLATAGSGDVLAGIIAGLAAQGMPVFEAAASAAWLHAEAGKLAGPGAIAEDFVHLLPAVLAELI